MAGIAAQAPALRANRAVLAMFDGRTSSELHLALFDVVSERRQLRVELEREMGWQQEPQSA